MTVYVRLCGEPLSENPTKLEMHVRNRIRTSAFAVKGEMVGEWNGWFEMSHAIPQHGDVAVAERLLISRDHFGPQKEVYVHSVENFITHASNHNSVRHWHRVVFGPEPLPVTQVGLATPR